MIIYSELVLRNALDVYSLFLSLPQTMDTVNISSLQMRKLRIRYIGTFPDHISRNLNAGPANSTVQPLASTAAPRFCVVM